MQLTQHQAHIRQLLAIAVPVSLQMLLFSSRSMVDIMMLGQLGDHEVAAMGIAGRASYIATLLIVGVTTGGGVLLAQYWGKRDSIGLQRAFLLTLGLCSLLALLINAVFAGLPQQVMGLSTTVPEIAGFGADYLFIVAWATLPMAIGIVVATGLRAIHRATIPTAFSCFGVLLNVGLNYLLIFGKAGMPALGIEGAAYATLISCVVEVGLLVLFLGWKKSELFPSRHQLRHCFSLAELQNICRLSAPVIVNMFLYSFGLFMYSVIFGHIDVQALAALTVMIPIESIAIAFLIGVGTGTSVVIGNEIGANKMESAYQIAKIAVGLSLLFGVITAIVLWALKSWVLGLFSGLDGTTLSTAEDFYTVLLVGVVIRALPISMIVGVLRAGGDNQFCLIQDTVAQWGVGVPLVALLAFVTPVPIAVIYMAVFAEEVVKIVLSTWRIASRRWLTNHTLSDLEAVN
ncbi:MATE family efflux transporter [Thaumasiovibrio subtropicus]|uniref:MATE family efflux transporter n=1 Tax=Thaumasiovibrio subtropicus TaxID=1891207 RepID=UPI000B35A48F|nr:MATE family efflux transporter [Thaumasiovibrio subtropicus]